LTRGSETRDKGALVVAKKYIGAPEWKARQSMPGDLYV
jgi:hypothetical protein